MKAWSVIGLLATAAILATVPISPQVTQRGVELSVNQAQAVTYGRYRRVTRRAYRRAGYVAAAGYTASTAGYGYGGAVYGYGGASYGYGGPGYAYAAGYGPVGAGYRGGYGYHVEPAGYGRSCAVYPSGFRWCWTQT